MARRKPNFYSLPDGGGTITASGLKRANRETKLDVMKTWFFENYEDPVENTPYESAEGGYQYIWGGPYDAHQELDSEFGGIVADKLIEELADNLSDIAPEWTSAHHGEEDASDEFDNFLIGGIDVGSEHQGLFLSSLSAVDQLLGEPETKSRTYLHRLLYANVITALETYLSDFFVSRIKAETGLLRKFIETTAAFKEQKICVSEVFGAMDTIEKRAYSHLAGLVWHRLDRIRPLYENTLGVKFPDDLKPLLGAIVIRHEIVHRNGKREDGSEHDIKEPDIRNLMTIAKGLVDHIEKEWLNASSPFNPPSFPA